MPPYEQVVPPPSPMDRILSRLVDLVEVDAELRAAIIDAIEAHAATERARARWYDRRDAHRTPPSSGGHRDA